MYGLVGGAALIMFGLLLPVQWWAFTGPVLVAAGALVSPIRLRRRRH